MDVRTIGTSAGTKDVCSIAGEVKEMVGLGLFVCLIHVIRMPPSLISFVLERARTSGSTIR
jgi:hypothetical protein